MEAHIFLIHCDGISCLWHLIFSHFECLGFQEEVWLKSV